MSKRYFLATPPVGSRAVLEGDEARHVARVMRAKPGENLEVFDGTGRWWPATVTGIGRNEIGLELGDPVSEPDRDGPRLTVAVALPKGDRQRWLVEKLTELGVSRLVPLRTSRGVAEPTPAAVDRLRRGVVEACKQCGRCRLLEIAAAGTLESAAAGIPTGRRLLADRGGGPLLAAANSACDSLLVAVGPEGGFTAEEMAAAEAAGFARVSLGPHILRIETAAIAAASIAGQLPSPAPAG